MKKCKIEKPAEYIIISNSQPVIRINAENAIQSAAIKISTIREKKKALHMRATSAKLPNNRVSTSIKP